jgi:hypothetical protein
MHPISSAVSEAAVALDGADSRDGCRTLADDELLGCIAAVEALGRRVDALRVTVAAELEARSGRERGQEGLAQRHGFTRGSHFVELIARVSSAEASRRVRLGAALRPGVGLCGQVLPPAFPLAADAVARGDIGTDAARTIIDCLTQASRVASRDDLDAAETALVAQACTASPDLVAVQARVWREALDPDGAEPREATIRRRRALHLGREVGGLTPFSGLAEPTFAALLRSALSEGSGQGVLPRFLSDADRADGTETVATRDGDIVERLRDPRTRAQRHHDILAGMLAAGVRAAERGGRAVADESGAGASSSTGSVSMRPLTAVTAVVHLKDLRDGAGSGWLDDVLEPVSAVTIRQLACDGGIRPIVLGDNGEVLHLGRTQRLFSPAQRRALAVRDGGCVWPSCTAPPGWCQAHHVTEWERGGRTDVDNGALLCSAHHHMLHASEFTMRMIDGRPRLLSPPWLDPEQAWRPLGRSRARPSGARSAAA